MTYEACLRKIEEKNALGTRPGLFVIQEMLRRLKNPEKGIPAVQIAGTNGKGSILAYTESILIRAGLCTGRYASPAVFDYRDKYLINGKRVSKTRCALALSQALRVSREMVEDGLPEPTSFETETAAAFLLFQEAGCQVILVECGMGGKEDATNVLEEEKIAVLASVSLDHVGILGNTVGEIAATKLGITRQGETLILFPRQTAETLEAVQKAAKEKNLQAISPDLSLLEIIKEEPEKSLFRYRDMEFTNFLPGRHQIYNAITAVEVCRHLDRIGLTVPDRSALSEGIRRTRWPGRWTILERAPMIILDGAHNEKAWTVLADNIRRLFPGKKLLLLTGVFRDKEYEKMTDILSPFVQEAAVITPPGLRGLPAETLAELFQAKGVKAKSFSDKRAALGYLKKTAREEDVILCTGSLSFLGEMMELVKNGTDQADNIR